MNGPVLKISELSTLNFRHDWRLQFQYPVCYTQRILPTDNVLIQYTTSGSYVGNIGIYLTDSTGADITKMRIITVRVVDGQAVWNVVWPTLAPGGYMVQFRMVGSTRIIAWSAFCVVDELEDSVLFTYNNYRDDFETVFTDTPTDFRVEAVWLPGDAAFMVKSNHFRDQNGFSHQLSAFPYETRTLTLGGGVNAFGVPNWVARKVNAILSCSSVFIDGEEYVRSDGAVPERVDIAMDYPLFMYKIALEPQTSLVEGALPEAWVLASEDGKIIVTEDGRAIDMYLNN